MAEEEVKEEEEGGRGGRRSSSSRSTKGPRAPGIATAGWPTTALRRLAASSCASSFRSFETLAGERCLSRNSNFSNFLAFSLPPSLFSFSSSFFFLLLSATTESSRGSVSAPE